MESQSPHQGEITQKEKEFAALSYMWIFALLVYFSPEAKSKFVKHHAKQALVLFGLSVIFYFLPGVLSYINVLILFLMILGIIESSLGHWYYLPIISDWLEGKFKRNHFSLFSNFWQKIRSINKDDLKRAMKKEERGNKGFFSKDVEKIQEEYKDEKKHIRDIINKDRRRYWSPKIKSFEKYFVNVFKGKVADIETSNYGVEIVIKNKKTVVFGGIEKDKFVIAYLRDSVFLMGDESYGEWEINRYNFDDFNKESFEAFVDLLFEE